jgi:uncharacterized membrane protein YdbT with pleckstrin-like domain
MIHLQPEENIELKARKHWFILFRTTVGLLIVWLLPFIIWRTFLIYGGDTELFFGQQSTLDPDPALISFFSALWSLLIWMKLFAVWTDYYLDIWIVTNRKLVSIDQIGLFNREISTLRMERIQDVTFSINGIVATLLNFGDIHVQTAAEEREFVMRGIAHPDRVKRLILTHIDGVVDDTESATDAV